MRDIQTSGPATAKRKKLFVPLRPHLSLSCKSSLYFWPFRIQIPAFRQAYAFFLRCSVWTLCSHCNQGFHSPPTFLHTFSWNLFTSVPSCLLCFSSLSQLLGQSDSTYSCLSCWNPITDSTESKERTQYNFIFSQGKWSTGFAEWSSN